MGTMFQLKRNFLNQRIFTPEQFGALGDGKHDDGPAFLQAVKAISESEEDLIKILQLKEKRTYRILSTDENNGPLFKLCHISNLMIVGNETRISIKLPCGCMSMEHCKNVTVAGIDFGFNPSPMFIGKIERFEKDGTVFDFAIDPEEDCGFPEGTTIYELPKWSPFFMVPDDPDRRQDFFITKMELLSPGHLRIYQDVDMVRERIKWYMEPIRNGDVFVLPRIGLAHRFPAAIGVLLCDDILFESCQLHDVPCFCVSLWCNGRIKFKDFHLEVDEKTPHHLVSWRDGFHCKNQYKLAEWEECTIGQLGDDIYNIATTFFDVKEVYSKRTFSMWPHEGSLCEVIRPGDTLGFLSLSKGEFYGDARITKVEYGENASKPVVLTIDTDIPELEPGVTVQITYDSENPIGHIIRNCNVVGSIRVKAPTLFLDSNIRANIVYINNEERIEGPIPKNVTLRNCTIETTMPGQTWLAVGKPYPTMEDLLSQKPDDFHVIYVDANGTGKREERKYHARNIRIEGCRIKGHVELNDSDVTFS